MRPSIRTIYKWETIMVLLIAVVLSYLIISVSTKSYTNNFYYYINFDLFAIAQITFVILLALFFLIRSSIYLYQHKSSIVKNFEFKYYLAIIILLFSINILLGATKYFLFYHNRQSYTVDKNVIEINTSSDTTNFNKQIAILNNRLKIAKELEYYICEDLRPSTLNVLLDSVNDEQMGAPGGETMYRMTNDSIEIVLIMEVWPPPPGEQIHSSQYESHIYFRVYFTFKEFVFTSYLDDNIDSINSYNSCLTSFTDFFKYPNTYENLDFSCHSEKIINGIMNTKYELERMKGFVKEGAMRWQLFIWESIYRSLSFPENYYKPITTIPRFVELISKVFWLLYMIPSLLIVGNKLKGLTKYSRA